MAYCAIYNLETHEVEFEEQWDADHTEGIQTDWTGTIEQYYQRRLFDFATDCAIRGWAKWKVYASETEPFSWDAVTPKVEEKPATT